MSDFSQSVPPVRRAAAGGVVFIGSREKNAPGKKGGLLDRLRTPAPEQAREEPAPPTEEERAAAASVPEDALRPLWARWSRRPPEEFELYETDADSPLTGQNEDLYAFYLELQQEGQAALTRPEGTDADAEARARISSDGMRAWLFLFAPMGAGRDIEPEDIRRALQKAGVFYGIDPQLAERAAGDRLYYKILAAACGQDPVHGENGSVVDCIPRDTSIETSENQDGSVDYRNVNEFRNIRKGTVVCRINPPTEGTDGINVRGEKVKARHGRPADIPRSSSVVLSKDGTELVAATDGHISFENNKFIVEKLLVIDGDVDVSVGNIHFDGDVVIAGDVRDSFEVHATGSVTVRGMAEDALIEAGGSITLEKGMNGNGSGTLDAQGDIHSKFLENCIVRASGSIYTSSIIWCNIACDDCIYALTGKGVIIGGTCVAQREVQACVIGSKSNRVTTIVLGNTPNMLERKKQLEEEIETIRAEYAEIVKSAAYLEQKPGPMSGERKDLLNRLRLKKPVLLMKESRAAKKLEALEEEMADVGRARVLCDVIYPFSKIVIGEQSLVVESVFRDCLIRLQDGAVSIGLQ